METDYQVSNEPIEKLQVDGIILGVHKNLENGSPAFLRLFDEQSRKKILDFSGKEKEKVVLTHLSNVVAPRIVLVGLGEPTKDESIANERIRQAAAIGAKLLRDKELSVIAIDNLGNAQSTAEGVVLGLYEFKELKTSGTRKPLSRVFFASQQNAEITDWNNGVYIAKAQNVTRRLAELPANIGKNIPILLTQTATPAFFVSETEKLFKDVENVQVIAHDTDWAESKKMGSFLSVTRGSDTPAKFMEIHYKGSSNNQSQPLVLIGKGITFDSGGISLKPAEGMGEMRGDCGGAASVIGTLLAVSKLKLPVNIIVLTPLTENMPNGRATKPSDVVFASNGKSIEVNNTDAEGRLILADALVYAASFNPHTIIDVATLTGAIGIALGKFYSGAFTNSTELWREIENAGIQAHEPFWRMPLAKEYRKLIDSEIADMKNSGGRKGGSSIAASFLQEFVSLDRWIHLDIASTALPDGGRGEYTPANAMTGIPVRALVQFVRNSISQ